MLTGICTHKEVLDFFAKYAEKEYPIIDDDDKLFFDLLIAGADDLIKDDVDYWANESVKKLLSTVIQKLKGE
jgi:hypothetical protein